jgi:hypothetical protein
VFRCLTVEKEAVLLAFSCTSNNRLVDFAIFNRLLAIVALGVVSCFLCLIRKCPKVTLSDFATLKIYTVHMALKEIVDIL